MVVKKTRSKFESDTVKKLKEQGVKFGYEALKIKYRLPDKSYTPDILLENGIIIELKGYFRATDRALHKAIKAQHPKLDIRFVFMSSKNKIHKSSNSTYGDWCKANGFKYADKEIPLEWIKEKKK
jgi:hypothetical protein